MSIFLLLTLKRHKNFTENRPQGKKETYVPEEISKRFITPDSVIRREKFY